MPRSYTQLVYHLVFSTKLRSPCLDPTLSQELYRLFGAVIHSQGGALLAVGGVADHVHLLARLRAYPSLGAVVRAVKGCTSHWINQERRLAAHFAWQEGYGAFTVSPSVLAKVKRCIERQEEHHRTVSFEDEMLDLLARHGINVRAEELEG